MLWETERQPWKTEDYHAVETLKAKGYLSFTGNTMNMNPVILLFFHTMQNARENGGVMVWPEGTLYTDKGLWLWAKSDERRLDGITLHPYPSMEQWYGEEKEDLEHSLEFYRKELKIHG